MWFDLDIFVWALLELQTFNRSETYPFKESESVLGKN